MPTNYSYTDSAELYCKAQIYNNLSHSCHIVIIRLPQDYMNLTDVENCARNQCENQYISFIKIIGVGATVLGHCESNAKY